MRGLSGLRGLLLMLLTVTVLPAAGVGALVWTSSAAMLSAPATAPESGAGAADGALVLSDDARATALFAAELLTPGSTGSRCVSLLASGRSAARLRLYGTSYASTRGLAGEIALRVEQGLGRTTHDCAGFVPAAVTYQGTLASFAGAARGWSSGLAAGSTDGDGDDRLCYRITYRVDAAAPNSAQGGTARLGFTWESQPA